MGLLLISVHYHCGRKWAECDEHDELIKQIFFLKHRVLCGRTASPTQEPLCGGLACQRVSVDLRQAAHQSSGLAALTEAPQQRRLDNSVRLSFTA